MARMKLLVTVAWLIATLTHVMTENVIEEIFKGRCEDYKIKYPEETTSWKRKTNATCVELWKSFDASIRSSKSQSQCTEDAAGFDEFFPLARQIFPKDKVLFWSGTKPLSLRLGGRNYVTLEHSLVGYLVDSLINCQSGPNRRCPPDVDCWNQTETRFWIGASTEFAKQASGTVTVLLNGSRTDDKKAYFENSTFAKHELPALTKDVTMVKAFIAYDLGMPPKERCDEDSLKTLRDVVEEAGHKFECIQEPDVIRYLMCVDDPKNNDCPKAHASRHGLQAHFAFLFTWLIHHSMRNIL